MESIPTEDEARFDFIKRNLYTPVIGDVLDSMGFTHQFLPQAIGPIEPTMFLAGRAMPVLITDAFGKQSKPFGRLTEALDSLETGEIYLARSGRLDCAAWGELLTVTARMRGAVGAVIDGYHRDTPQILTQDWPVFSRGCYAQDAQARALVADFRVPIEIEGVLVSPGDLVVGDRDGVLVVPRTIENEVLEMAAGKAASENLVRTAIENGMSSTAAFEKYGVL